MSYLLQKKLATTTTALPSPPTHTHMHTCTHTHTKKHKVTYNLLTRMLFFTALDMFTYSACQSINTVTPASILASNCPQGTCCASTLIHGSQAVIAYLIFEKVDACPLGDQLNESIFLPPFSVIFENSKSFNFWEFIEFFFLMLLGWMIGVMATYFYYFGFSRKVGYKEVPMNDISSDDENFVINYTGMHPMFQFFIFSRLTNITFYSSPHILFHILF